MRAPHVVGLFVGVVLVAGACVEGSRPSLEEVSGLPATETAADLQDRLTETVDDVLDEATQPPAGEPGSDDPDTGTPLLVGSRFFTVSIVETFGHDTAAFTQGLEFDGDTLYESRGLYGESALTTIDPATGDSLAFTPVIPDFFAEGLTVVDDRLVQLTWLDGVALVYDKTTLEEIGRFSYDGEGWGLCYDGESLFMSNGTNVITRRDPATFEVLDSFEVTLNGRPVVNLNELECVDDLVWVNIWQADFIAVLDPETGTVIAEIDASSLRASIVQGAGLDSLNGIAFDSRTERMILTGKQWPAMFAVEFVPCVEPCVPEPFPTAS